MMPRMLAADTNVSIALVDATTGELKHSVIRKNTAGPGLVKRLAGRGAVGTSTNCPMNAIAVGTFDVNSEGFPAVLGIAAGDTGSGSFWQRLYKANVGYAQYARADAYSDLTVTSSTSSSIYYKASGKFTAAYTSTNTTIKSLMWFSSYYLIPPGTYPSNTFSTSTHTQQNCHNAIFAAVLLTTPEQFVKTANDILYVDWTVTLSLPNRSTNEF